MNTPMHCDACQIKPVINQLVLIMTYGMTEL